MDEGARETSIPSQRGECIANLGGWNVAEEAAAFQTRGRWMLHVAGLSVGRKGSIDLGRECHALRSRTERVPRVLVLLLVWHLAASFWRAEKGSPELSRGDERGVVGCFLLERHARPRTTLLAFPAE